MTSKRKRKKSPVHVLGNKTEYVLSSFVEWILNNKLDFGCLSEDLWWAEEMGWQNSREIDAKSYTWGGTTPGIGKLSLTASMQKNTLNSASGMWIRIVFLWWWRLTAYWAVLSAGWWRWFFFSLSILQSWDCIRSTLSSFWFTVAKEGIDKRVN